MPVEPENGAAIAATIKRFADDPGTAREFGERGRTWVVAHAAREALAQQYLRALEYLRSMSRGVASQWSELDVLVTPTLAREPIEIGALRPEAGEPAMRMLENAAEFVPFTPVWNVTGQPAISLPLHQSESGLPIGVQFVGPPAGEELLLSLSARLEEARPWADRRPELATA